MLSSMFDKLKKVQSFIEIKGVLCLEVKAEAYIEPKRASMKELLL